VNTIIYIDVIFIADSIFDVGPIASNKQYMREEFTKSSLDQQGLEIGVLT
jgi:hypothetical protein